MLKELAEYGPEILAGLATLGSALGAYNIRRKTKGTDAPWYYGFLAGVDTVARPLLDAQRLKVQRKAWQKRPSARPIALHTHSRNKLDEPVFPKNISDDDVGSYDAHQSMEDIAKTCREGVVECVLMTEHNLDRNGAELEIEWAKELQKKYKTKFLIGSEVGTTDSTAGGHVIYVPSRQENILNFIDEWDDSDDWPPGPVEAGEIAYNNGDFIMIPHPGKGEYYDEAERYFRIKWRLQRKDIDKLIRLAKDHDMILPIASANANLPNAEFRANQILLGAAWKKDNVREYYENDSHWSCDLHGSVLYGKFNGRFTGEKLYEMFKKKRYEQVFADVDAVHRPWGKLAHLANHAAQFKLLGF